MRLYLLLFIVLFISVSSADVKSTSGQIKFDVNSDSVPEMTLNSTGLGLGVTPSTNLHISGNAVVSEQVFVGTDSGSANLNVGGTLAYGLETVSSNVTLSGNSIVLADASNGNLFLRLPYAGNVLGRVYTVKKTSTENEVNILGHLIDGEYGIKLNSGSMGMVKLISSDNFSWNILSIQNNTELWTPASIATSAWFDVTDSSTLTLNSGNVSQWNDKSGNDNHLSEGTATLQPTLNGDQLDFVNGDILEKTSGTNLLVASGNHSVFFVHQVFDPTSSSVNFPNIFQNYSTAANPDNRRPIFFYNRSSGDLTHSYNSNGGSLADSTANLGKRLVSATQNSGTNDIFMNGAVVGTSAIANQTSTTHLRLRIGDSNDQNLIVTFHEIIFIAGPVDTDNNQKIEGYLAWKWGLESNLDTGHPYKNEPPKL